MEVQFVGKRALVTGAGKGIGRAIAIALMKGGADTYAISRTQADVDSLEKEVPGIHTICIDISDWNLTKAAVEEILQDGDIDLLVNNAGVRSLRPVGSIEEEDAMKTVQINLLAAINIAQEVAKGLKAAGKGGSVVNMSSISGLCADPIKGMCVYAATKGGLDAATRVMAMELGPHKIRVNSINPTIVWTDLIKNAYPDPTALQPFLTKTPLGKFAELEDIVHATLFLLSDKANMITGVTLPVDGGLTAC